MAKADLYELLEVAYEFLSGKRQPEIIMVINNSVTTDLDQLLADIKRELQNG